MVSLSLVSFLVLGHRVAVLAPFHLALLERIHFTYFHVLPTSKDSSSASFSKSYSGGKSSLTLCVSSSRRFFH